MKTSAKRSVAAVPGHKARLYVGTKPKKVWITLPVATPAEIRRSLNLSSTAKQRVERAMAKAGLKRKAG
jgi:hypothetical protein